jgi:hypothetical protein
MCFPVAMGNALATHTEPSAKLITAHTAHHCDGHAPHRPGIIIDSRSTVWMEATEARRGYARVAAWDEGNLIQAMARLKNPTIAWRYGDG